MEEWGTIITTATILPFPTKGRFREALKSESHHAARFLAEGELGRRLAQAPTLAQEEFILVVLKDWP